MTFHKAVLIRFLDELERTAAELERYRAVTGDELSTGLSLRWTVERGLLAGLGVIFQVADHVLATHFQHVPETYEGLLRELRQVGVISDAIYTRLRGAGGFRNVLVHEYVKVDPREVARFAAAAPDTFRGFARDVLDWVEGQSAGQPPRC